MASKLRPVEVTWVDSAMENGWTGESSMISAVGIAHCMSCGYLLSKDKEVVKLVMSHGTSPSGTSYMDGLAIPMCAVVKIRNLS